MCWFPREVGSVCDKCTEGRVLLQYASNSSSPRPCAPSGHWSPREAEGKIIIITIILNLGLSHSLPCHWWESVTKQLLKFCKSVMKHYRWKIFFSYFSDSYSSEWTGIISLIVKTYFDNRGKWRHNLIWKPTSNIYLQFTIRQLICGLLFVDFVSHRHTKIWLTQLSDMHMTHWFMTLGAWDNMEGSSSSLPSGWWCMVPLFPKEALGPKPRWKITSSPSV